MEQAPAITSVEAERAKANQNKLIAEACQRIIEQSPAVPYKSYEDAAEKLSAYHILASVDAEAADMSETADGAGRGLLMSRGHVWHEHALRRACNATRMLHELQQRLEKRLRDDTAAAEPSGKKRRLFEEYQGLQWALEALAPMEAANAERKAKHEARSREIAAEMSKLDAELAYCKAAKQAIEKGSALPSKPQPVPTPGETPPVARAATAAPAATAHVGAPRPLAAAARPVTPVATAAGASLHQKVSQGLMHSAAQRQTPRPMAPPARPVARPAVQQPAVARPAAAASGAVALRPEFARPPATRPQAPAQAGEAFKPLPTPMGLHPTGSFGSAGPAAVNPDFGQEGRRRTTAEAIGTARRLLSLHASEAQQQQQQRK